MSLHANKPETEMALRRLKRRNFLTSLVIGFLSVILLLLLLSVFLLSPMFVEAPTLVTYESGEVAREELDEKKVVSRVERKPSSPAPSMTRVIAARTESQVAVPMPEVEVTTPSLDFGDGEGWGDGWGSGDGIGSGGGGATFFNQSVKADRIAFVIDYSMSMRGARDKLMRAELKKSISKLQAGTDYQMIFFAGPAWVAGDEIAMAQDRKSAVIKSGGAKFDWTTSGGAHGWQTKGKKQVPEWLKAGTSLRRKSLKQIEDTPLVWGTTWEPAIEMALSMDPPPQIIYFMTDGSVGGDMIALARRIASRARTKRTVINTIAMMQPKAEKAMAELARRSGGQFTVVEQGGKVREVPLD